MITLNNITLRHGAHILFERVNWTMYAKQHIGIIGANGSGKTSLFAMLLGQLQADVGDLELPKQLVFSHVAQETPAFGDSALEYVLDGDHSLRELEAELKKAEEANDGTWIATVHMKLSEIDAYTAHARAAQLLSGLGFPHHEHDQSVASFSGGWRVRLNLAKALMARSDILLLDEPTNHLDLDAIIWLEKWLAKYPGTLLIISHDREFLDQTVDHVAYLSNKDIALYTGNYSSFEKQRAMQLQLQQVAYEKQQKQIAHMQSFVDRFGAKASKAKQAQSRVKAIERLELISAVHMDTPLEFKFKTPNPCPNPMLYLDDAGVAYGDKVILRDLIISIGQKDRIGILGPNGAGKSSFIKLLAGEIEPYQGQRVTSSGLKIGYFAQHQVDELHLSESPLAHMREIAGQNKDQELRGFLGGFGFSGNRVTESVRHFSGGEKSRLALAMLIWQKPNLLLLDEPTNHLDLDMRHSLNMALQQYEGAMILVSHDRFLMRSTVDQLLLIADQKMQPFEGDINEYEQWLTEYRRQQQQQNKKPDVISTTNEPTRKTNRKQEANIRNLLRPIQTKLKKYEDELTRLTHQLTDIEVQLTDPALYEEHNKNTLRDCLLKQTNTKKQLELAEQEWLKISEEREQLMQQGDAHE